MPNHVATQLVITGDSKQLKKFRETHLVELESNDFQGEPVLDADGKPETYTSFEFGTVIPAHPDLYKVTSPVRDEDSIKRIMESSYYNLEQKLEQVEEVKVQMELAKKNIERFGYSNWYDFCCREWGTKWGAYDLHICQDDEDILILSYNTAWSPACPVLDKLAEMYPNLSFNMKCLDEGMGFGVEYEWSEGVFAGETDHKGSHLYEFANEHFGADWEKCPKCGDWMSGDECYSCEDEECEDEECDECKG